MTKHQFIISLGLFAMAAMELNKPGLAMIAIVCQALYFFNDEV